MHREPAWWTPPESRRFTKCVLDLPVYLATSPRSECVLELGLVEEHAEQFVVIGLSVDEDVGELLVEDVAEVLLGVARSDVAQLGIGGCRLDLLSSRTWSSRSTRCRTSR
jgi:hypothetical protein